MYVMSIEQVMIFESVVAVLDLMVVLLLLRRIPKILASRFWPETDGKITGAKIRTFGEYDDNYSLLLTSTYKVAGVELEARYELSNIFHTSGFVKKVLDEHPIGTTLLVHYNPIKPQQYITKFDTMLGTNSFVFIDPLLWLFLLNLTALVVGFLLSPY
jgi:hypothetical protein